MISEVGSNFTLHLQGLPVAVGTLPETLGEVLLPLKHRHQPLVAPLPVKKKNFPQIVNIDQGKVGFLPCTFPAANNGFVNRIHVPLKVTAVSCSEVACPTLGPFQNLELQTIGWGDEARV